MAAGYALRGDVAAACRWLRLAFERDASQVAEVEADSDFDGIRADAAFRALLAEGGGTTAEG